MLAFILLQHRVIFIINCFFDNFTVYTSYTDFSHFPQPLLTLPHFCLSFSLLYKHLSHVHMDFCCNPLSLKRTICGALGLELSLVAWWAWY